MNAILHQERLLAQEMAASARFPLAKLSHWPPTGTNSEYAGIPDSQTTMSF
jgi:hypothetical protein